MPWSSTIVENRKRALELLEHGLTAVEAAQVLGVSRQTLQKWKKRLAEEGEAGLADRSRAPKRHPDAVSSQMERRVLKLRRKYGEGPRKLRVYLLEQYADEKVPAASTIGLILRRHGLTEKRKPRRQRTVRPDMGSLRTPTAPNEVWCIDFKGQFRVGGRHCYPLTVTDAFSRFVVIAKAEFNTSTEPVQAAMWRAFRKYGLPTAIRSDNGAPFASDAPLRLSKASAIWVRLGIERELIEPGKPQQNGRHERFHKTLKQFTAKPPARNFRAQQRRFDTFRRHFNQVRPHEALNMTPPAKTYAPSLRPCPDRVPPIEHPEAERVVRVYGHGGFTFRGTTLHISKAISKESIGVTEVDDDLYELTYGHLLLAHLSFRGPSPRVFIHR